MGFADAESMQYNASCSTKGVVLYFYVGLQTDVYQQHAVGCCLSFNMHCVDTDLMAFG